MNPYQTRVGFYPYGYSYGYEHMPQGYVGQLSGEGLAKAYTQYEERQRTETWTYVLAGAAIAGLSLLLLGRLR